MADRIFRGIFDSDLITVISVGDFLLCMATALVLGLILALVYIYRTRYTKSFVITLALLPAVVCVVIMLVNGNVGTGVAVAGAFSLVRFRSVPGTAKEICTLFLAMGAGLIVEWDIWDLPSCLRRLCVWYMSFTIALTSVQRKILPLTGR